MKRVCLFFFGIVLCLVALTFYSKKRVLVIAPTKYEEQLQQQFPYKCLFYKLPGGKLDLSVIIEEICSLAQKEKVDAIISSNDYAGTALASITSQKLGLIGAAPLSIITCQHKYYSRIAQRASVPEATAAFSLGPNMPFPCFVKPVRSSFTRYAEQVSAASEIQMPDEDFFDLFDQLIAYATDLPQISERILAEEVLEGHQVTWEGYVSHGQVQTIGIVDSIMYPGTISFERFEYPSSLPEGQQRRIVAIATTFLHHIGLDNTLCNIEFMYDPRSDRLSIIECNPRMAGQFSDLYEKVDGTNSYELALAIATGGVPKMKRGQGKHKIAASFVLRRFEDGIANEVPSKEEIAKLQARFSDLRVFFHYSPGQKLSEIIQDGKSFRYALIHLGGSDKKELQERFEECKKGLTFTFTPLDSEQAVSE